MGSLGGTLDHITLNLEHRSLGGKLKLRWEGLGLGLGVGLGLGLGLG